MKRLLLSLVLIMTGVVLAQDAWWYGSNGDGMWGTSANWAGGTIGGTNTNDNVLLWPSAGNGSVALDYSTEIANLSLSVVGAPESSSQLTVDGAVLTVNGVGTWVGDLAGMSGTLQITNGGAFLQPNGAVDIGYAGNAELIMDSGLLTCGGWFRMTDNSGGSSHISMTGGVVNAWGFWMTGDGVDDNLLMELNGGEIILTGRGDVTGEITGWINAGWITGNEVTTYYDDQTSYTHITSIIVVPQGDLNGDYLIDVQDLFLMALDWLESGVSGYDDYFPRGFQSGVIPSFQVPRAVTPPVIDGMFYPNEWDGGMAVEVTYPDIDTAPKDAEIWVGTWPTTSAELSATWYFKWDPNNLYVAASVYDDSPSSGDKLQLGFDFGDTAPEYLLDNSAIYNLSVNTVDGSGTADIHRLHNDTYIGDFTEEQKAAISFKGSAMSDGYLYEAAIPWWVIDFLNMPGTYVPAVGDHHGIALFHLNYNDSDLTTAMSAFSPLPWGPVDGSFASKTITLVESSVQDSALSWNTGPAHYYPLQSIADLCQEAQPNDIVNIKDFAVLAEDWATVQRDIIVANFESNDYRDWEVTGTAFGPGPAQGTLPGQMVVTGFLGRGLVNTFYNGDASTGTLASPEFKIQRSYINFLIGGGGYAGQTCINLLVNGQVVRTAVGPNTESGGSEQLDWHSWNVGDLLDQRVQIQIVDQYTGGWGHISIDQIVQSNKKWELVLNKERVFELNQKYLNFPVKSGAAKRWIRLFINGQRVREFDIELATSEPDFWVYLDVSEFEGKQGTLQIDRYLSGWETGFDVIAQADMFPGQENLYQEKRRPQFHFSSRRGWLNDTNGMVYHDRQYHLFYQHNPYGWNWGNMTWGHAVSADMVHWQEWGDAIHPDALGTVFSGSAVVDQNNTSGLQTGSEKPIVAFYTSAGGHNQWSQGQPFTQSMAYSNDRGHTWTKYAQNPVLGNIVSSDRDPKVFWHEPTGKWVMVVYFDGPKFSIFDSSDLKTWQKQSDIEGLYECPEMFELSLDSDPANKKWVVYGANGDYKIGRFDGTHFVAESDIVKFEYGNCFYASQTFNNIPASDGRRIQMGWGRVAMPGMPFNQMVLFPVTLTLHTTADGIRMYTNPIKEIESLHQQHWNWSNESVSAGQNPLDSINGELFHIKADLKPQDSDVCKFVIRDVPITYDVSSQQLTCQGRSAPLALQDGKISLEILVDRMSIEIYANGGRIYMPIGVDLVDKPKSLELTIGGGDTLIESLDVYELDPIWF